MRIFVIWLTELNKKCNQAQSGIESLTVSSSGVATKSVTFNPAFDDIPVISTAFRTAQLGTDKMCISSITNKQVIFAVYTTAAAHGVEIHWRAEPQK